jgi:anti-sigma factor RsiW
MFLARRGALDSAQADALVEHLQSCEACRSAHRAELALDEALAKLPRRAAPPALAARAAQLVERATNAAAPAPAPEPARSVIRSRRPGARVIAVLAACAVVALAVFGGLRVRARDATATFASEAVSDHLRLLYADHGLEVASGGLHRVRPWFEGRLDFAPPLAFEGDDEFPLEGGSVAVFMDRKAAAFVFKRRLHAITLLVFRAEGLPSFDGDVALPRGRASRATVRGFPVLLWRRGDVGYALVSDTAPGELDKLAAKIDQR